MNLQQMQRDVNKVSSNTDLLAELEKIASDKGFVISDNEGSGNCMFYALSEQLNSVKGIKISHGELRQSIVQYLRKNPKLVSLVFFVMHILVKIIFTGEDKSGIEIELCELADAVAAVGPKLTEAYSSYLRFCKKHQDIIELTPGIFSEFSDIMQATNERDKFKVLTFGRGDPEDFSLKGYDIAAKAIVELKDSSYHLVFVGAPDGKQEEVAETLLQSGISRNQLFVRRFIQRKERLKELFCEVDLAIMPSRTEGFGLTALEALSAGLPILVSGNSGFGDSLRTLPLGKPFVMDSADPKDWAKAIEAVRLKDRAKRLQEIQRLRASYEEKFSWKKQCGALVEKMWTLVHGKALT